jgi:Flp pilus assembly protein TadB
MNDSTGPVGLAVTAGATVAPWLVNLNEILQAGVHIIAIVAGISTAWYYIDRTIAARRARKGK